MTTYTHGTDHPAAHYPLTARCGAIVTDDGPGTCVGPTWTRARVLDPRLGMLPPCPACFPETAPAPDLRGLAEAREALAAADRYTATRPPGAMSGVIERHHLRTALTEVDRLTTRVAELEAGNAAAAKRWMWSVATEPTGGAILSFRPPGEQGFALVATALPRGDGMLSVRVNGQAHTADDDLPAALATIRAILGADVPEISTHERSES